MGLEARIDRLESATGIGTSRPWPAEWSGTPETDADFRRMLLHNPDACFREAPGMMKVDDDDGQPLQAG
jgi:hypothetical protein